MSTVITAPEPIDASGFRVYLAGAIDMGRAVTWQAQVIAMLADRPGLVLLNPRRDHFDADTLDEQIRWELDALDAADVILMWFPADANAPISLLETGLYLRSGKLLIGAEPGYERRRNLEITTERYGVPLWPQLHDLVEQLRRIHPRPHTLSPTS